MPTLLQDKVFVFAGRTKPSDSELEILNLIFEAENLGQILAAETVKNGENYDSYKITANGQTFLIKTSLDEKNKFGTEKLILDEIPRFAPRVIAHGGLDFGATIYYLITTWENAQPIQELGQSLILENQESFFSYVKEIHKETRPFRTFQEYLAELFEQTSFKDQEEFRALVEKNSENYQLLWEELEAAKQEIRQNFKTYYASDSLIHGNLSENTILVGREGFKFINWESSFCAHPLFELAILEENFGFGANFEFSVVQKSGYSWAEYSEIKNFWANVSLLRGVFSFIKEIYLYNGRRHSEILSLVEKFYRNVKNYEKIPIFKKNREEILGLFNQVAF